MEAIILAGGFGTRLAGVISNKPKVMASVNGTPFLSYVLNALQKGGIRSVILAVSYKYEVIQKYYGDRYGTMSIQYSVEKMPLDTGGAIKKAMDELCKNDFVLAINGDTFLEIDYQKFYAFHKLQRADISLALSYMENADRYGVVDCDSSHKVLCFHEKKHKQAGYINGGNYIVNRNSLQDFPTNTKFSFEKDFLEKKVSQYKVAGFKTNGYFIDIGIPEDLQKAQSKMKDDFIF